MLVTGKSLVDAAAAGGYAVGSFNVADIAAARGVVQAAEQELAPVMLQLSQKHIDNVVPLDLMAPVLVQLAKDAKVPVAVHLDHGFDPAIVYQAMQAGFTSVMIDASNESLANNRAQTQRIVEAAHALNISVEAELGPMRRDAADTTVDYAHLADTYTDVAEAQQFVEDTGVDMLAVAFGTVHGVYSQTPHLNFERLDALHAAVPVPLVVHGGSGLLDDDYRRMVQGGIAKINYFSNMAVRVAADIREHLNAEADEKPFVVKIAQWEQAAVCAEVREKLPVFGASGQANK